MPSRSPFETMSFALRTRPAPRRSRIRDVAAEAGLLGLLAAGLAVWMVGDDLRAREATARTEAARLAARLAESDAQRAALETRVDQLERELHAAQAEASRQSDAVRETAELSAQLSHDLEAAQEHIGMLGRGLRRRDREIDRLLTGVDERLSLGELLATPGVELMRLRAVAPFHDVHGHVIWHPARTALLLYAFSLPPAPAGGGYRVRVALDDGRLEAGPAFTPGPRGDAALPVRLSTDATHLRAVEVVLDPAAEPVLAGRKGTPTG